MDGSRFDSLTRTFSVAGSRRGALGGLLVGTLGSLGLAHPDAAAAKKRGCKQPCGECQRCHKGKCRKTKTGKKRCKRGRCKQQATGSACTGGRTCLANGSCARPCTVAADCGPGCACFPNLSVEGQRFCTSGPVACAGLLPCTSTAACPQGQHCKHTLCDGGSSRCISLCPA